MSSSTLRVSDASQPEHSSDLTGVRVLYVEDNALLAGVLSRSLIDAGFRVDVVGDAPSAIECMRTKHHDIAVIDWCLPGTLDGLALARWARTERPRMGIVMLSAVDSTEQRHRALREACDDFLAKPSDAAELVARLHAVARRTSPPAAQQVLTWGPVRVDLIASAIHVHERRIGGLQPLHVRTLAYLIQNAGRVCTHQELRQVVFGAQAVGARNCARVVSVLRARCGPECRDILKTFKGEGYGFAVGVH